MVLVSVYTAQRSKSLSQNNESKAKTTDAGLSDDGLNDEVNHHHEDPGLVTPHVHSVFPKPRAPSLSYHSCQYYRPGSQHMHFSHAAPECLSPACSRNLSTRPVEEQNATSLLRIIYKFHSKGRCKGRLQSRRPAFESPLY